MIDRNRHLMIRLQYKTFQQQSLMSLVVYLPSLCVCTYLINFKKSWSYDSNVIFNNTEFNVAMGIIIVLGVASYVLSLSPNWTDMVKK